MHTNPYMHTHVHVHTYPCASMPAHSHPHTDIHKSVLFGHTPTYMTQHTHTSTICTQDVCACTYVHLQADTWAHPTHYAHACICPHILSTHTPIHMRTITHTGYVHTCVNLCAHLTSACRCAHPLVHPHACTHPHVSTCLGPRSASQAAGRWGFCQPMVGSSSQVSGWVLPWPAHLHWVSCVPLRVGRHWTMSLSAVGSWGQAISLSHCLVRAWLTAHSRGSVKVWWRDGWLATLQRACCLPSSPATLMPAV